MNVLAIDVGKKTGLAFSDGSVRFTEAYKIKTLSGFYSFVAEKIELYSPDIIVVGRPTRFHNTIVAHSKYIGIIEMACEKRGLDVMLVTDSSCKKVVLGSGKASKEEIVEWASQYFKDITEDEADALMFTAFALQTLQ